MIGFALGGAATVSAQMVDQHQLDGSGQTIAIHSTSSIAQSFTVGRDGLLTGVELSIHGIGPSVAARDLRLEVLDMAGGNMSAAPSLGSVSIGRDELGQSPPSLAPSSVTGTLIDLSPLGLRVRTGEVLAIRLSSLRRSPGGFGVRVATTDPYPAGRFHVNDWPVPVRDAAFRTIVTGASTAGPVGRRPALQSQPIGQLRVRFLGGPLVNTPVAGVRVLRNDPVTGALLDDQVSNSNGIADFGYVGALRSSITVVQPGAGPGDDDHLYTLVDVPAGTYPFPGFDLSFVPQAQFDVRFTGVPSGQDAWVSVGEHESDDAYEGTTPLVPDVEAYALQPTGLFSLVTATLAPGGNSPTCGVLLDQDPTTISPGATLAVNTSTPAVSLPFASTVPVYRSGAVRRNGLYFEMLPQDDAAALSGTWSFCDLAGADRYLFEFETAQTPTQAGTSSLQLFPSPPASLSFFPVNLSVGGLSRTAATIDWTPGGAGLPGVDLAIVELEWDPTFGIAGEDVYWEAWIDGSSTSFGLPQLPPDLASLSVPTAGVSYLVFLVDVGNLTGYDSVLGAMQQQGGIVQNLVFASDSLSGAGKSQAVVGTYILGGVNGSVTVNGMPASHHQFMEFPGGEPLTVIATPAPGFTIAAFFCGDGPPIGNPNVQQTCTFTAEDYHFIFIAFN